MQKTLLLVVADSSRVRFFTSVNGQREFREHDDMAHPAGRLHAQQLTTDLPGTGFTPGGARHGFSNRVSVKEHERKVFARQIADHIEKARVNGEYTEMILIASPVLLGELRGVLSSAALATIRKTVDKNLVRHSVPEILSEIEEELAEAA